MCRQSASLMSYASASMHSAVLDLVAPDTRVSKWVDSDVCMKTREPQQCGIDDSEVRQSQDVIYQFTSRCQERFKYSVFVSQLITQIPIQNLSAAYIVMCL